MALSSYAPRLRTALVLSGTGTAGVYHAGVLRALTEAGIKVDVVAAHGVGAIGAVSGAVDSGSHLWAADGPWMTGRAARAYRWRQSLRIAAWALGLACAVMLSPLLLILIATAVYGAGMVASLANLPDISNQLLNGYTRLLGLLFDPPMMPTIVPRLVVLVLLVLLGVLLVAAWQSRRGRRRRRTARGLFWWRLLGHPLDPSEPQGLAVEGMWRLTRGATGTPTPAHTEMGRRYVDLVTENFGQPGFREVVLAVHDLDARRDLVVGLIAPQWESAFAQRRVGAGPREAEALNVATCAEAERGVIVDAVIAGVRLPVASAPHEVTFPVASFWQGETHRWCDRPELVGRLIDEVARLGVEQIILVTPAPPAAVPHDMRARRVDFRHRMGETVRSVETAAFQEAWAAAASRFSGVFAIRPDHNPIGPFDFTGTYDESSDRVRTLPELMQQGYDDAYRQFIEPVVATGERIEDGR